MILLESAQELHEHLDECHFCACGAREGILCFAGRLLLTAALGEAALIHSRASAFDRVLAEQKPVALNVAEALRAEPAPPAKRERKPPLATGLQNARKMLHGARPADTQEQPQ